MRIVSANLNGIRSARDKGFFEWLIASGADVCCVQEIKAQEVDIGDDLRRPTGYVAAFHAAEKKGYSGVGIYSRRAPDRIVTGVGIADIDAEGRYLQADFGNLSVVSLYLPSGSSSPERQAAKFSFMERFWPSLTALARSGREVILCGDWNIAHREIDLKNWKGNLKNSGFLPEERAWLSGRLSPSKALSMFFGRWHPSRWCTPGGAIADRRMPRTSAGASTIRSRRRASLRRLARARSTRTASSPTTRRWSSITRAVCREEGATAGAAFRG